MIFDIENIEVNAIVYSSEFSDSLEGLLIVFKDLNDEEVVPDTEYIYTDDETLLSDTSNILNDISGGLNINNINASITIEQPEISQTRLLNSNDVNVFTDINDVRFAFFLEPDDIIVSLEFGEKTLVKNFDVNDVNVFTDINDVRFVFFLEPNNINIISTISVFVDINNINASINIEQPEISQTHLLNINDVEVLPSFEKVEIIQKHEISVENINIIPNLEKTFVLIGLHPKDINFNTNIESPELMESIIIEDVYPSISFLETSISESLTVSGINVSSNIDKIDLTSPLQEILDFLLGINGEDGIPDTFYEYFNDPQLLQDLIDILVDIIGGYVFILNPLYQVNCEIESLSIDQVHNLEINDINSEASFFGDGQLSLRDIAVSTDIQKVSVLENFVINDIFLLHEIETVNVFENQYIETVDISFQVEIESPIVFTSSYLFVVNDFVVNTSIEKTEVSSIYRLEPNNVDSFVGIEEVDYTNTLSVRDIDIGIGITEPILEETAIFIPFSLMINADIEKIGLEIWHNLEINNVEISPEIDKIGITQKHFLEINDIEVGIRFSNSFVIIAGVFIFNEFITSADIEKIGLEIWHNLEINNVEISSKIDIVGVTQKHFLEINDIDIDTNIEKPETELSFYLLAINNINISSSLEGVDLKQFIEIEDIQKLSKIDIIGVTQKHFLEINDIDIDTNIEKPETELSFYLLAINNINSSSFIEGVDLKQFIEIESINKVPEIEETELTFGIPLENLRARSRIQKVSIITPFVPSILYDYDEIKKDEIVTQHAFNSRFKINSFNDISLNYISKIIENNNLLEINGVINTEKSFEINRNNFVYSSGSYYFKVNEGNVLLNKKIYDYYSDTSSLEKLLENILDLDVNLMGEKCNIYINNEEVKIDIYKQNENSEIQIYSFERKSLFEVLNEISNSYFGSLITERVSNIKSICNNYQPIFEINEGVNKFFVGIDSSYQIGISFGENDLYFTFWEIDVNCLNGEFEDIEVKDHRNLLFNFNSILNLSHERTKAITSINKNYSLHDNFVFDTDVLRDFDLNDISFIEKVNELKANPKERERVVLNGSKKNFVFIKNKWIETT